MSDADIMTFLRGGLTAKDVAVARNTGDARAALAFLRTSWIHPRSLIEPNLGVFGVHLLHLGERAAVLRPAADEIFRMIAAGEVRPIVDRTFPLTRDGAVAAHRWLHERRNLGKVVLEAEG